MQKKIEVFSDIRLVLENLKLFRLRLWRLKQTRLAKKMWKPFIAVRVWNNPNGDEEGLIPEFDSDALDAFLFNYRLLTQNNERVSIGRIAELIETTDVPDALRIEFNSKRKALNSFLDGKPSVPLPSAASNRRLIDVLLYGLFAHLDPAKYKQAVRWHLELGHGLLMTLFIETLSEVLRLLQKCDRPVERIVIHLSGRKAG